MKNTESAINRSAPVLSPSPLLPSPLPQLALISTRRKKDNEKKRNLRKLKRRLALSSSLKKRRIVNMDKIRGTHSILLTIERETHPSVRGMNAIQSNATAE